MIGCRKPFMLGAMACPCGRCLPCLVRRRREWSQRLVLEARGAVGGSSFVTLTYDREHVPPGEAVNAWEVQGWLKRLRSALSPVKIRFYAAGEYGSKGRPHYHVAVFGVRPDVLAGPLSVVRGGARYYCDAGSVLSRTWGKGFVSGTDLNEQSASYICGYVTKKLVVSVGGNSLFQRDGRRREFARMSLRPGLGCGAVQGFAAGLSEAVRRGDFELGLESVPGALRVGGKVRSIGRYLSGKLLESAGLSVDDVRSCKARAAVEELQRLREEDAIEAESVAKSTQEIFLDKWKQKCMNIEARFRVFDSGRSL